MKTSSMKMMMVAGFALAALAGGVASADARGFGHGGFRHGGFHGGFGHRGFGYGRFGYGRFGHHRRFYHRGFRQQFGGLGWGYPSGTYFLSSNYGDCRAVFSPLLGGYERVCS